MKQDIFVSNNLLFYNSKIIVPKSLRKDMLELIHAAHFGINKSKLRARQIFYWPHMSKDIENFINNCQTCQMNRPSNSKETLRCDTLPVRPWQYLHSDFLKYNKKYYLLIVDAYSHWLEVFPVKNKTASVVIEMCKTLFAQFGVPDIFYADNNPYNSTEFKKFSSEWNFDLVFSSPHHHQSNGFAEKYVDITKRMLKKMKSDNDLSGFLLEYRNTPLPSIGFSPSQILLSRLVKTKIPICEKNLESEVISPEIVTKRLQENSDKKIKNGKKERYLITVTIDLILFKICMEIRIEEIGNL